MRYAHPLRAVAITVPVLLAVLAAPALAQSAGGQAAGLLARSTPGGRATSDRDALTPGQARLLSRNVTDKVIVVLRNQVTGIPDIASDAARRTAAVDSLQAGCHGTAHSHACPQRAQHLAGQRRRRHRLPGEASLLAASPAVAEIIPDQPIPLAPGLSTDQQASGGEPAVAARHLPAPQPGPAGPGGDREHPRRHPVRQRELSAVPGLHRREGEGRLHRRRRRPGQPGLHPR